MATITFQVIAAQTTTHSRTIPDAHLTRLLNAERALRNMPSATDAQIIAELANDLFGRLIANVLEHERRQAATTAINGVVAITIT